jgi:HNH endonuclease
MNIRWEDKSRHVPRNLLQDGKPLRELEEVRGLNWHEHLSYDPETGVLTRLHGSKPGVLGCPNKDGYLCFQLFNFSYRVHRVAWEMAVGPIPPGMQIDHINRVKTDNRLCNLRVATNSQNGANTETRNDKKYRGVNLCTRSGRWLAQIKIDQRMKYLGRFSTPEEAACAYDTMAAEAFGEFATLNFPPLPVGAP